jgi:hypothetical protein
MRRSGGLRFTSRDVTVFRSGRVEADADPLLGSGMTVGTRRLSDPELAELHRALDAARFTELPPTAGRPSPDAYSYEIAARVGGSDHFVETFDGSIPDQLAPLIRLLSSYLRPQRPGDQS